MELKIFTLFSVIGVDAILIAVVFTELIGIPAIGVGVALASRYHRRNKIAESVAIAKIIVAAVIGLSLTGLGIGLTVSYRQCERVLIGFGVVVGVAVYLSVGVIIVSPFLYKKWGVRTDEKRPSTATDASLPVNQQERSVDRRNENIGDGEGFPTNESCKVPSKLKMDQSAECTTENNKNIVEERRSLLVASDQDIVCLQQIVLEESSANKADQDVEETPV